MPESTDPTVTPPATPPGAEPAAPPAPSEPPADAADGAPEPPATISMTTAQLDERLKRHEAALLRKLGLESPDDVVAMRERLSEAEKAEQERQRAELSEVERLKAEIADWEQKHGTEAESAKSLREELDELRAETHLRGLFVERGISNADYALYLVDQKIASLDEGADFDEAAFLDEIAASDQHKAALGIAAAPGTPPGANTTHNQDGPPPRPETPGEFDAMAASPEDVKRRLADLGFHG